MVWFPWNGSKNWMLGHLEPVLAQWPAKGRYIEPFVGGGSVSQLVRKLHPEASQVLGDANPWLISAYEQQLSSAPIFYQLIFPMLSIGEV